MKIPPSRWTHKKSSTLSVNPSHYLPVRHPDRLKIKPGHKAGRWSVLSVLGALPAKRGTTIYFLCMCECGTTRPVKSQSLTDGVSESCGCYNAQVFLESKISHGMTGTAEYRAWQSMHRRCRDAKGPQAKDYALRGITVCERWGCFENFLTDMGRKPSRFLSIERVDKNGNYEPSNCIWGTKIKQARNKRNNHMLVIGGVAKCVSEWAEENGLTYSCLYYRLKSGWPTTDIFSKSIR